jgi:hypothetical protein
VIRSKEFDAVAFKKALRWIFTFEHVKVLFILNVIATSLGERYNYSYQSSKKYDYPKNKQNCLHGFGSFFLSFAIV